MLFINIAVRTSCASRACGGRHVLTWKHGSAPPPRHRRRYFARREYSRDRRRRFFLRRDTAILLFIPHAPFPDATPTHIRIYSRRP